MYVSTKRIVGLLIAATHQRIALRSGEAVKVGPELGYCLIERATHLELPFIGGQLLRAPNSNRRNRLARHLAKCGGCTTMSGVRPSLPWKRSAKALLFRTEFI